jgi:hypothetical protein
LSLTKALPTAADSNRRQYHRSFYPRTILVANTTDQRGFHGYRAAWDIINATLGGILLSSVSFATPVTELTVIGP